MGLQRIEIVYRNEHGTPTILLDTDLTGPVEVTLFSGHESRAEEIGLEAQRTLIETCIRYVLRHLHKLK